MSDPVIKNACPHCGSRWRTKIQQSHDCFSATIYHQCTNFACGFCAVGQMTLTHETTPSKLPNLAIQSLPSAQSWIRKNRAEG